jgi:Replication protein
VAKNPLNQTMLTHASAGTGVAPAPGSHEAPWYYTENYATPPEPINQIYLLRQLDRWQLKHIVSKVLKHRQVSKCYRVRRTSTVNVKMNLNNNNAYYEGFVQCHSAWVCPICAAKISEYRADEVLTAFNTYEAQGGHNMMLTFTHPHAIHESLASGLEGHIKARRIFFNRQSWKKWAKFMRVEHRIRALEPTHTKNGWHPHTHELLFLKGPRKNVISLNKTLLEMWQSACMSAGLRVPNEHGLRLEMAGQASDYLAKWGTEKELTKSHIKIGHENSYTPFDMLRKIRDGDTERDWEVLFREFDSAFFGKKQLLWSRGLRKAVGLEKTKSDEQITEHEDEMSFILGSLTIEEVRLLVKACRQGELLYIVNTQGWSGALRYLQTLTSNGAFNYSLNY